MFTLSIYTNYYTVIITIVVKSFVATAKVRFAQPFRKMFLKLRDCSE